MFKTSLKIIAVVLIIFSANFFQKDIRYFLYQISLPAQKVLWKTGASTSNFFVSIIKSGNFKKERDELVFKNQELEAKIISLENSKRENESLKSALDIGLQNDFNLLSGEIISKDVNQDFILIDRGSIDGVSRNMPVITSQKVLIGKVCDVFNNFSKVMLISNKDSSFGGRIAEKDISGVIRGKGNLKVFLDLIPQDKEILKDDVVSSSNLDGFFPAGLLIGQITEARRNDIESFQQADLNAAFNLNDARYIFIIID